MKTKDRLLIIDAKLSFLEQQVRDLGGKQGVNLPAFDEVNNICICRAMPWFFGHTCPAHPWRF